MKMKPARLLNHPEVVALKFPEAPKADREAATARSYRLLVTRHGVSPEKARKLLGLT